MGVKERVRREGEIKRGREIGEREVGKGKRGTNITSLLSTAQATPTHHLQYITR